MPSPSISLKVEQKVISLLDWPTDTFSIDVCCCKSGNKDSPSLTLSAANDGACSPRTIIFFVPGNPGLIDWYIPFFEAILHRLGPGFAVRGCANAGHSLEKNRVNVEKVAAACNQGCFDKVRDVRIPWTIDGQVLHKAAFVDHVLENEERQTFQQFVFVSHSIGAHFTQRLCMLRPDILRQTQLVLHLMPFIRMDAPILKQTLLNFAASVPDFTIHLHKGLMNCLESLPIRVVDVFLRQTIPDKQGRRIAVQLVRLPSFASNFFTLGLEEIRDVPQIHDVCALRVIGRYARTVLLFAGNDHWSPKFHLDDLGTLQQKGIVPDNISIHYQPKLKHDFVTEPSTQVPAVVDLCVAEIRKINLIAVDGNSCRSRL